MTMPTATITELPAIYFEDYKPFYRKGCPEKRDSLMVQMKVKMQTIRKSFSSMFPNKSKRKDLLGHILLLTSVSGIVVVSGKKLAENVGCSVDYVYKSMPFIKETGEIIVTGLADGDNKYVFILKSHENFPNILKDAFFMDITEPTPEPSTEPKCAENADVTALNDGNSEVQSFKSLQSFSSTQEKDIIRDSIESDFDSVLESPEETRAKLQQEYHVNSFQLQLFDYMMDMPFPSAVKDVAGILVLIAGNDCDAQKMVKARCLINKIVSNMINGVQIDNVKSVFRDGINKPLDRYAEVKAKYVQEAPPVRKVKPVPFYNWLEIRE